MDPVSILGLVASAASIGDIAARSISTLNRLNASYRNIPLYVSTLIGQLSTVESALHQISLISTHIESNRDERFIHLESDMNNALNGLTPLMVKIQEELEKLDVGPDSELTTKAKLKFLRNGDEMQLYQDLLYRQTQALSLLLQAIQCRSLTEQRQVFHDHANQVILERARDCSSSINGLADSSSIHSENTNAISLEFDFDSIILGSRAYQTAQRSHLRRAIRSDYLPNDVNRESHLSTSSCPNCQSLPPDYVALKTVTTETEPVLNRVSQSTVSSFPRSSIFSQAQHSRPTSWLSDMTDHLVCDNKRKSRDQTTSFGSRSSSQLSVGETTVHFQQYKQQQQSLSDSELQYRRIGTQSKVLLAGIPDSGKSTMYKAFKLLAGHLETSEELLTYKKNIYYHLVTNTIRVLLYMDECNFSLSNKANNNHAETLKQAAYPLPDLFPFDLAHAINCLWSDEGFLDALSECGDHKICENTEYFAHIAASLCEDSYIPSREDMLRTKNMTHAVHELSIDVGGDSIHIVDMSGTRRERTRRIRTISNLTTIIFTADTTAFAKPLPEDESINSMKEQVHLFHFLTTCNWQTTPNMVLLLTKIDLLPKFLSKATPSFPGVPFKPGDGPLLEEYLAWLEFLFLKWMQPSDLASRVKVVRANLIDIDNYTSTTARSILLGNNDPTNDTREWI